MTAGGQVWNSRSGAARDSYNKPLSEMTGGQVIMSAVINVMDTLSCHFSVRGHCGVLDPHGYRPISKLPFLSNNLEKLMSVQPVQHILGNSITD